MEICPSNKCTGCHACINACTHHCITIQENEYDELHPIVDDNLCLHCNLCIQSCPNNIDIDYNYPPKCFASWIKDKAKRKLCASGGIGTIMSEFAISHKNGIVFGSRYSKDFTPIITYTENLTELEYFKGSRYVQSLVDKDTFRQVKTFLKKGRFVLYIGTPCQIAGLSGYLNKCYDNLITVDLICHGVCPTKYFKEEVKYITSSKGIQLQELTDIRFRGNDGKNFCLSFWKDKKCIYNKRANMQYYFAGFLSGISLRESCYSCNYARPERVSDITIGDFIGLGKTKTFNYPKGNVSSVTLNTEKGMLFYSEASSATDTLLNIERDYSERLSYRPSLVEPFKRHKLNPLFREKYLKMGYLKAIRKVLGGYILKNRIMKIINIWRYSYKVPRKMLQLIKD